MTVGIAGSAIDQWHYLGGESLQAFDRFLDRLTTEIEDQFVHADGRETANVAGDVIG